MKEAWTENTFPVVVNFAFPRSENGDFLLGLDRWDEGGEDSYIDLEWHTWGFGWILDYGMQFPKSVWGDKRVRFELSWQCGTTNFSLDVANPPEAPAIHHLQTSVIGRSDDVTTVTTTFATPPVVGHGVIINVIGRTSAARLLFSPYACPIRGATSTTLPTSSRTPTSGAPSSTVLRLR